jgi:hypothetical protein
MRRSLLLLAFPLYLFAQTPFSQDSATAFLKTLSVEIGPRPMGSPNERRAMEFALQKFREFGLNDAYIMGMAVAGSDASATNTRSGVAVGVLKGETDRIILIGGHIDSAGPDIPGANDDGSGSATVIELARVLAQTKHKSTLVFCLFGGEESNLRGSRYFAEHYPDTSKIALMLQVDMANGTDWLLPMFETHETSAPQWLVSAAYEEFGKLPYLGLSYPTHFYTINYAFPAQGASSDHDPFLAKGIPAIDFTSDPNDPIHVSEDKFENFKPAGLKRSGDLVYNLVQRFDTGVPEEKTGSFFTLQFGTVPFFIPSIFLKVINVVSLLLAALAIWRARKRRFEVDRKDPDWKKIPALKLFLLALVLQSCVWFSINIVGLMKGVRYPWYADYTGYFLLSFFGGVIGIWLSLQIARRWSFSRDPYRYFLRAVIFLLFFIFLLSLTTARMAFYPAIGLLLISCAMLVRNPVLKFLLWIASPHLMYRLLFNEAFGLLSRGFVELPVDFATATLTNVVFILNFALWSFPFLLAFAAVYFDSGVDLLWLKKFRMRVGAVGTIAPFVAWALYLSLQPTFSQYWKQRIYVEQSVDATKGSLEVRLKSGEFLNGTKLQFDRADTSISTKENEIRLRRVNGITQDWLRADRSLATSKKDSVFLFDYGLNLHTKYRPYELTVTYSAGKGRIVSATSPLAIRLTESSATVKWYSFPDTLLFLPIRLEVVGTDSLTETIDAKFVEKFVEVSAAKTNATPQYRTTIWNRHVLKL